MGENYEVEVVEGTVEGVTPEKGVLQEVVEIIREDGPVIGLTIAGTLVGVKVVKEIKKAYPKAKNFFGKKKKKSQVETEPVPEPTTGNEETIVDADYTEVVAETK